MASLADTPKRKLSSYLCARCGRKLFYAAGRPQWLHSTHTGARYCWPGEGCNRHSTQEG